MSHDRATAIGILGDWKEGLASDSLVNQKLNHLRSVRVRIGPVPAGVYLLILLVNDTLLELFVFGESTNLALRCGIDVFGRNVGRLLFVRNDGLPIEILEPWVGHYLPTTSCP